MFLKMSGLLLIFLLACSSESENEIILTDKPSLAAWETDRGKWIEVGNAYQSPENPKMLASDPGKGVYINGKDGKTKHLFSKLEHGDCKLHLEFMVPEGSNSGVYLMGRYEVQVFDSWGVEDPNYSDCGGIYQRWKDGKGFEGHPPRVNASRAPGEWQSFDITFCAPKFDDQGRKISDAKFVRVVHNGKLIHENVSVSGPTRAAAFKDEQKKGPLMLQGDHGPVAYRNIRITSINCQS